MSKVTVAGGGGGGGGGGIPPMPGTKVVKMPARVNPGNNNIYVKLEMDGLPIPEPSSGPGWVLRLNILVVVRTMDANKCLMHRFLSVGLLRGGGGPSATIDDTYCSRVYLGTSISPGDSVQGYCGYNAGTKEIQIDPGAGPEELLDAYFIMLE